MQNNMVPLMKMSKKQQKAYHAQRRGSWNGVNPVSRVVPNGKAYSRTEEKRTSRKLLRDREYGKSCGWFWFAD